MSRKLLKVTQVSRVKHRMTSIGVRVKQNDAAGFQKALEPQKLIRDVLRSQSNWTGGVGLSFMTLEWVARAFPPLISSLGILFFHGCGRGLLEKLQEGLDLRLNVQAPHLGLRNLHEGASGALGGGGDGQVGL